jgi:hypothetical protein
MKRHATVRRVLWVAVLASGLVSASAAGAFHLYVVTQWPDIRQDQADRIADFDSYAERADELFVDDPEGRGAYLAQMDMVRASLDKEIDVSYGIWAQTFPSLYAYTFVAAALALSALILWPPVSMRATAAPQPANAADRPSADR